MITIYSSIQNTKPSLVNDEAADGRESHAHTVDDSYVRGTNIAFTMDQKIIIIIIIHHHHVVCVCVVHKHQQSQPARVHCMCLCLLALSLSLILSTTHYL